MQKICMNCGLPQLPSIEEKMKEEQHKWARWAEAMAKPVEKAQRQESVEPIRDNHLLFHERQQELRTKALNLAITFVISNKPEHAIETAQRFYTYITKGE